MRHRGQGTGGRLQRWYGGSPVHALALLGCFALAGWAVPRLLGGGQALGVALWFVGAVLAHDLLAFPAYTAADRVAARVLRRRRVRPGRAPRPALLNHVRVPVLLSGLLLVVWYPLVLGTSSERYAATTAMSTEPFLGRWLAVSGVLVAGSALLYGVRLLRARRARATRVGAGAGPALSPAGVGAPAPPAGRRARPEPPAPAAT